MEILSIINLSKIDFSLLKRRDLSIYIKYLFFPLRYIGDIQEIAISKETKVTTNFLERKYNTAIKLVTVDNRVILRALQYKFLNRSIDCFAIKQPKFSAKVTFDDFQKKFLQFLFIIFLFYSFTNFNETLLLIFCFFNIVFFLNIISKAKLLFIGKIREFSYKEWFENFDFPIYSIIIPLYKESKCLKGLIRAMCNLNYPKNRLDIKLVIEQYDRETIAAINKISLPEYFEIICVPFDRLKTKPKACNYALRFIRGKLVTIYDAEDRPEAMQLKKAAIYFKNLPDKVICLQSKINFYNKRENLLTRLMSIEYRQWFERFLPALDNQNLPIPLGGNSNHFKVMELKK